ncbi:hypothetical protein Tco_0775930, partial [Tanacetum coccineum]
AAPVFDASLWFDVSSSLRLILLTQSPSIGSDTTCRSLVLDLYSLYLSLFTIIPNTHAPSHNEPEDTSVPPPPSLKSAQIQELMAQPEISKLLASHNFVSCLPTDLKELPSKFTKLSREIKELKHHVKDIEIKLPGDLKEIPTKLETFTSIISSLTSQVTGLKNIQWELLVKFATVVENASRATTKDVPSAGQATTLPAEGEKNTKDAETNLKDELVDLLGTNVVTQYYNKKLLFDKECDKMLKRKKKP